MNCVVRLRWNLEALSWKIINFSLCHLTIGEIVNQRNYIEKWRPPVWKLELPSIQNRSRFHDATNQPVCDSRVQMFMKRVKNEYEPKVQWAPHPYRSQFSFFTVFLYSSLFIQVFYGFLLFQIQTVNAESCFALNHKRSSWKSV